jgi:hypothetical protein
MPGRLPQGTPALRIGGLPGWIIPAASLACGDAADRGGTASEVSVRDSAGIEIVENSIPEDPALVFVTSDAPSLVIGAVEGDEGQQLHRVQDALRLPDGRIAVLNTGSHEVRTYGADGSLETAFGRQGDGPSEFARFPSQLELVPPDTLVVWDMGSWETSWFLADGTFIRKEPGQTEYETHIPDGHRAQGGFAAPGEGLILRISDTDFGIGRPAGEVFVPSMELTLISEDGDVRVLGDFGGREQVATKPEPGRATAADVPFGTAGITAFGGRPARVWAGRNDRYELRQFTSDGGLERIVRADRRPWPVTGEDVDRFVAQMKESLTGAGMPREMVESEVSGVQSAPAPDFMPVFGPIFVTSDGGAWVMRVTRPRAEGDAERPTPYDVFGPDGRLRGLAEVPSGFRLFEIGNDYVLGLRRNDLGVEFVEVYQVSAG